MYGAIWIIITRSPVTLDFQPLTDPVAFWSFQKSVVKCEVQGWRWKVRIAVNASVNAWFPYVVDMPMKDECCHELEFGVDTSRHEHNKLQFQLPVQ